jgi:hypothetical protein
LESDHRNPKKNQQEETPGQREEEKKTLQAQPSEEKEW